MLFWLLFELYPKKNRTVIYYSSSNYQTLQLNTKLGRAFFSLGFSKSQHCYWFSSAKRSKCKQTNRLSQGLAFNVCLSLSPNFEYNKSHWEQMSLSVELELNRADQLTVKEEKKKKYWPPWLWWSWNGASWISSLVISLFTGQRLKLA